MNYFRAYITWNSLYHSYCLLCITWGPLMLKFDNELAQKQRVNLRRDYEGTSGISLSVCRVVTMALWRVWPHSYSAVWSAPKLSCVREEQTVVPGQVLPRLRDGFFSSDDEGVMWLAERPGRGPWVFTVQTGPRSSWKESLLVPPTLCRHDD